jgi:predicted nucleotidyltransferase
MRIWALIDLIEKNRDQIVELCRRYGVTRLDVFGSAATGEFEPGRSDVDLWVELQPKPPADHADDFFGLEEALEKLFGTHVDLVEGKAQKNPYFLKTVNASRVPFYVAA